MVVVSVADRLTPPAPGPTRRSLPLLLRMYASTSSLTVSIVVEPATADSDPAPLPPATATAPPMVRPLIAAASMAASETAPGGRHLRGVDVGQDRVCDGR